MRKRVAQEQPLCPDCQAKGKVTAWYPHGELDHDLALVNGGANDRENLIGRCAPCHEAKTGRDMGFRPKVRIGRIGDDGWPAEPLTGRGGSKL